MLSKLKFILWVTNVSGILLMGTPMWSMAHDQVAPARSSQEERDNNGGLLDNLGIDFSVLVEVEAGYVDDEREDGNASDITLATVEISVDVAPIQYVSAHLLFLFEEGDTDPIEVDEGYIRLDGEDRVPFYLTAGRQYLPFGRFESHFISDPLTLELGETRASSLIVGYGSDHFEIVLGLFNGDVQESDQDDDHIDGYAAGLEFAPKMGNAFGLTAGISYISNIGDSDGLQGNDGIDVDAGGTLKSAVAGIAASISAQVKEILFLEFEYVTALDGFNAGELAFGGGDTAQPAAYNAELSYQINDQMTAGLRLAGAQDGGDFLPEVQYGAVVTYALFDEVSIGLEYQYSQFDSPDDMNMTTVTAQLGISF